MAIVRKTKVNKSKTSKALKDPAKKTTRSLPAKRKITAKKSSPIISSAKDDKELIGTQEMIVGQSKFSMPSSAVPKAARGLPQELPLSYGQDVIVLQVRDPWWMHTYWEVTNITWDKLKNQLGNDFHSAKKVLRVYDVSNVNFNGKNAHKFFDIEVGAEAQSWYINAQEAGRAWCVDLGLRLPNGDFITIVRSNIVGTPLDSPSWITDEEWMVPEEMFARLYGMGFGFGQSSAVGKAWQERLKKEILSSGGLASMSSPGKVAKERKFWMWVDCELIVYGATEPDAKVTVQGKEIKLRPDGTFTFRYALPDGKQVIPVKAVSHDEIEEHTITPSVVRETKKNISVKEVV